MRHPWHTFRTTINWTGVAWYWRVITISVKKMFSYFAGLYESSPFVLLAHFTTTHTHSRTIKWLRVIKKSLFSKLSLRLSQKCEKKNPLGHSIVLFIAPCHHVAITKWCLVTYSRRLSKSFISKPNGKKEKLYIVATTNLLPVYKQPRIKRDTYCFLSTGWTVGARRWKNFLCGAKNEWNLPKYIEREIFKCLRLWLS